MYCNSIKSHMQCCPNITSGMNFYAYIVIRPISVLNVFGHVCKYVSLCTHSAYLCSCVNSCCQLEVPHLNIVHNLQSKFCIGRQFLIIISMMQQISRCAWVCASWSLLSLVSTQHKLLHLSNPSTIHYPMQEFVSRLYMGG